MGKVSCDESPPLSPPLSPSSSADGATRRNGWSVGVVKVSIWLSLILWTGSLLWSGNGIKGVQAQEEARRRKVKGSTVPPVTSVPVKFHEDHRTVQWCVNGKDEPEFLKYPWSEFAPLLQRKYYEKFEANNRYDYKVSFWPIKLNKSASASYSVGNMYQRAHFVLTVKRRKLFETGVNAEWNDTKIEGLIVQANFAPYGVGLPFGQFMHPKEFNCVDCKKPVGIPIACRRRTHMHIVHPTIMAYHHKMKIPQQEKDRQRNYCLNKFTPSQCIITGFKVNTKAANLTGLTKKYVWKQVKEVKQWQPLPAVASQCTDDNECDGKLIEWFKAECCRNVANDKCNETAATTTGGGAGGGGGGGGGGGTGGGTGGGAGGGPPPPPPPPPLSEYCPNFGAAATDDILADPEQQSEDWPTFECRPYEVSVCRPIGFDKVPRWESLTETLDEDHSAIPPKKYPTDPTIGFGFDPFKLDKQCCLGASPGTTACPPVPANAPPGPPKGPKRCEPGDKKTKAQTECVSRVVLPINRDKKPYTESFSHSQTDIDKCDDLRPTDEYGSSSEVHGNFVWHAPPCRKSPISSIFRLLIVHSFQRGIYSIAESYHELKTSDAAQSDKVNPLIPTPVFHGFPYTCETNTNNAFLVQDLKPLEFDYSRSYDACVQNVTGVKYINDQICPGIPKFIPASGKKKGRGKKEKAATYANPLIPRCDVRIPPVDGLGCDYRCPKLPSTTPEYVVTPSNRVIKRTLHGGINIVTNFCVMPICVFIARFYKETYNLKSYKGQKTWYWMHMIGAGGSTIFMYMGFFTDKMVDETDAHLVYGNLYIICLGLSYCTAWMRHKNRWISMIVESIHSLCGYVCFILALVCINNAKHREEPINDAVKYVVYVAIASLTIFYVGMTIHICSLDRKFGMKPKRWHFPSVEARFDDLPVPGRNIRKIFIFAVLFINLPLTLSTLFL